MNLNFIEDISSVDKSAYERLLNTNDSPFIKHSFLEALETSGCVSDIKGWKVSHLVSKKDGELGWPDDGIEPGTAWEDVPEDWLCPECGVGKEDFDMIEIT